MTEEPPKRPTNRPMPKLDRPVAQKPKKGTVPPKKAAVKKGQTISIPGLKKPVPLTLPVIGAGVGALVFIIFILMTAMGSGTGSLTGRQQIAVAPAASEQKTIIAETDTGDTSTPVVPKPLVQYLEYVGPRGDMPAPVEEVKAQEIKRFDDTSPPLKRDVLMSKEDFYSRSDLYELEDLDGDKYLAYRVRLPKNWLNVNKTDLQKSQLDNRLMGVLAYFVSPPTLDLRSSFRVKAQRLAHMMSVHDWLLQYAQANRYTIQAMTTYGDNRAEAIYVTNDMDVTYVVRLAVIINGPRVVIGEYWVPNDFYQEQKDEQIWAVTSFHLKYLDPLPGEDTDHFEFFDIASVDYPKTWNMQKGDIDSLDRMRASIVNLQKADQIKESLLLGRIDVFLFANSPDFMMSKGFDYINDTIKADELVIGDQIGWFKPVVNASSLTEVQSRVFKINNAQNTYQDYSYWVTVYKGKNYMFFICLLTPPKSANFYNWARNLSAYEYVLKTVREGI